MDNNAGNNRKEILTAFLTVILFVCLTVAGVLAAKEYLMHRHSESLLEGMRANADSAMASNEVNAAFHSWAAFVQETKDSLFASKEKEEMASEPPKTVPNPYIDSYLANEDMAGWLVIPDTNVDYPVMWTPRDEEYYLRRGFDGKADNNGCLILDTDSCLEPLTTNLIIHGHNMDSGTMFGKLLNYEDEDFYKEHKQMILYTEKCQRNYEVIAVFRSQVYRKFDQVFKYYKFFQADTQEEFDDFYKNIKALSQYDTGVTAQFGDHFLTLSTCAYHTEMGRFVVVAKEVEAGDYYDPFR